jgi:hypothetical protein
MVRKGETLGDAIQRIVDKQNKRAQKNMELFRAAGGEAGKSIDIMDLLKIKLKK